MKQTAIFTILVLGLGLMAMPVNAQSNGPYDLSWSTIDGGGGRSSGGFVGKGHIND